MKKTERSAVAEALKARNAAAKELAAAESKLIDFAGELPGEHNTDPRGTYYDALTAKYDAEDALNQLKSEIDQITFSYTGDRNRVGEYFLRHREALPAELLAAADQRVEAARAALIPIKATKEKLEISYAIAKRNAATATSILEQAAWAVLGLAIPDLAAVAQRAADEALRTRAALKFASKGADLSAPEFAHAKQMLSEYMTYYDPVKKAHQDAGAAPWLAAFNNLLVDPNAPLPTDPKVAVAA